MRVTRQQEGACKGRLVFLYISIYFYICIHIIYVFRIWKISFGGKMFLELTKTKLFFQGQLGFLVGTMSWDS